MRLFAKKNFLTATAAFVIGIAAVGTIFGLTFYKRQSTITSKVAEFLLGRNGEVNGFVLESGEQVQFSPETGAAVLNVVKVGDEVSVTGRAATKTAYGTNFHAEQLTANGQTITEIRAPRPPKGDKPHAPKPGKGEKPQPRDENSEKPASPDDASEALSANGAIKMFLVTPRGDVDGFILAGGEQIHFSPKVGSQITSAKIETGAAAAIEGRGAKTERGTILHAESLTIGNQTFTINE